MQRIGGVLALALTTLALVLLLALASRREVTPLDPTLSAVEVWQRAQQTQVGLESFATRETFTISSPTGALIDTAQSSLDRANGRAWLQGYGGHVGDLPVATPPPDLPPEVQAQQQQVMDAFTAAFGLAPGEQASAIELYYNLSTRTAYARANGHPWSLLSNDLWQRFGFADEIKPYEAAPTPVDLALAGTTSIDGVPVYRLTWTENGRANTSLVDGEFHVVQATSSLRLSDSVQQTQSSYRDFDATVPFPADPPR